MDGAGDHLERHRLIFQIGMGIDDKVVRVVAEVEEAEPFGQFHHGAGFGLFRRGAFSHLFFGAGQGGCIPAAAAEKNGNIQTAAIDLLGTGQNVQIDPAKPFFESSNRFPRGDDLVLIIGKSLISVL